MMKRAWIAVRDWRRRRSNRALFELVRAASTEATVARMEAAKEAESLIAEIRVLQDRITENRNEITAVGARITEAVAEVRDHAERGLEERKEARRAEERARRALKAGYFGPAPGPDGKGAEVASPPGDGEPMLGLPEESRTAAEDLPIEAEYADPDVPQEPRRHTPWRPS